MPNPTPQIRAASALVTSDTVTLSLWSDQIQPKDLIGGVRLLVVGANAACVTLGLATEAGALWLDVPAAVVVTALAIAGAQTVAIAVCAGAPPAYWWERPARNPDVLIRGDLEELPRGGRLRR